VCGNQDFSQRGSFQYYEISRPFTRHKNINILSVCVVNNFSCLPVSTFFPGIDRHMETRADVQHRITLIKDEFAGIMSAMEDLFDKIYALNELPIGSWKESQEKRLGKSLDIVDSATTIEEVIVGDKVVVQEKTPAPKKSRIKKMQVIVASPTGPVADEIINV
jgi:hypothetical protein